MFIKLYWGSLTLFIIQFSTIYGAITTQSRIINSSGKELIFGYDSYEDGKLTYAACDKIEGNGERKCKLVREKTRNSNDDTFTCDITLKLDRRQGNSAADSDRISVIPFGTNKAILYQAEEGKNAIVKINTINFEDCKVIENEISVTNPLKSPTYSVMITPYDDSYDVVYKNSNICANKGYCKVTMDSDGKIIGGPTNTTQSPVFVGFYPYVAAVDPKSRDKGTFYTEKPINGSFMELDFVVQKPDGSKKSLGKYKAQMPIVKSTSYNFLSMCYKRNVSSYNCIQYDDDGNMKFEWDPVRNYNKTDIALIYNLPDGGLLTLAGKCNKRFCEANDVQFFVTKIDSSGKEYGTLNIGSLNLESGTRKDMRLVVVFDIENNNNYCLTISTFHSAGNSDDGNIESNIHCFTDQDFSK